MPLRGAGFVVLTRARVCRVDVCVEERERAIRRMWAEV